MAGDAFDKDPPHCDPARKGVKTSRRRVKTFARPVNTSLKRKRRSAPDAMTGQADGTRSVPATLTGQQMLVLAAGRTGLPFVVFDRNSEASGRHHAA
jgi:hypothetical protein